MRAVAPVLVALLLSACGGPAPSLPPEDLLVDLRTDADVVEPGEAFDLEVRLVWRKDLDAPVLEDDALSPLVVRLADVVRREDAHRFEEVRRYRAHAFTREDVRVGPITLALPAPTGIARVVARSPELRLKVVPVVDETDPGPPELPLPLLAERPFARALPALLGLLLALALGGALLAFRGRQREDEAPEAGPLTGPRAALLALAGTVPADAAASRRQARAAMAIVRAHAVSRLGDAVYARTSPELVAMLGTGGPAPLASALDLFDRVRFGGPGWDERERQAAFSGALAFVGEDGS